MSQANISLLLPPEQIKTDRLVLRPYNDQDSTLLFDLISRNRSYISESFPGTMTSCKDQESTTEYITSLESEWFSMKKFIYAIIEKESQTLIGSIILKGIDWNIPKCEVGYYLDHQWYGKGLTTEAVKAVSLMALEDLGMKKLILRVIPGNSASSKVALKAGFKLEGILKNEFKTGDGRGVDLEYYGLTE
jgi:RimJ/RimL family protein N-acetyltransferase